MTVVGAASTAGMLNEAAELAYRFVDASYHSIDSRAPDEYGGILGVTCENRRVIKQEYGVDYANSGIEGYGWGALSIFLVIRSMMGLQEEERGVLTVAPVLPQALRGVGATYKIGPLPWGIHILSVECIVKSAERFMMHIACSTQQWEKKERYIFLRISLQAVFIRDDTAEEQKKERKG